MGITKVVRKASKTAKQVRQAAAARNGKCSVCGKTIRGGAGKANVCGVSCAQRMPLG